MKFFSLQLATLIFGATVTMAAHHQPDIFDSLLLPEASDSQAVLIMMELNGNELIDAALSKTADPRFSLSTTGRDRLWQLLATTADPTSSRSVWRQDQLDELELALTHGSLFTKGRVAQSLQRPAAALTAQTHAIIISRVLIETDAAVMHMLLESLASFRLPLSTAVASYVAMLATELSAASPGLDQSNSEYQQKFFSSGRDRIEYSIAVSASKVIMQASPDIEAAMLAMQTIKIEKPGAVAEAMVQLAIEEDSIYTEASLQGRQSWILEATTQLANPESRAFVDCCLREAAAALYLNTTVPASTVTGMIVAPYTAHGVSDGLRKYTSELIMIYDGVAAVPAGWLE